MPWGQNYCGKSYCRGWPQRPQIRLWPSGRRNNSSNHERWGVGKLLYAFQRVKNKENVWAERWNVNEHFSRLFNVSLVFESTSVCSSRTFRYLLSSYTSGECNSSSKVLSLSVSIKSFLLNLPCALHLFSTSKLHLFLLAEKHPKIQEVWKLVDEPDPKGWANILKKLENFDLRERPQFEDGSI